MKNSILQTTLLSASILAVSSPYAFAGKWNQQKTGSAPQTQAISALTNFEVESLKFMREEEKLARDVYLTLYDVWGVSIFKNIADSEQKHTDSVANLLTKYGIEDPVKSDALGDYTNPDFNELYHALVDYGSYSYEQALKVGTEIEELDIADLNDQLNIVNKSDITNVYNNLLKGSRNHLRSFYSLVTQAGFEYTPTHITQEEFDEIVNSESETGNINTTNTTSGKGRRGR
ncbi:DUF2202 domain-containing protein [Thiomicrorhabdus lithotrophica]|uniref:DUF2202 domain-containing protein n=1 Tax=Thiomicrorhabdus lithotrophica TaxID=2949997 RepID=A0ABY8CBU4_9GAMM|nr:DUF2202 domain-containing protein [Thiomicrorhabdus lithotrophica]WEJ61593.1 DUF2202 domain-containing protein [Thiomicrorhabdus lithotrophica]